MSSAFVYPLIGGQNRFMPETTSTGDPIYEEDGKPEDKICSYEGCEQDGETQLDGDTPVCYNHAGDLAEQIADQSGGSQPVLTGGSDDDEAAWLADDLDQNGNAYLSLKKDDGEYVNLFPDSDLLQKQLNEAHDLRK